MVLKPLREVASGMTPSFPVTGEVWNLSLDEIESHLGVIREKKYSLVDELGPSKTCFDSRYVLYSKLRPYLNKVVLPDESGICTSELIPILPDVNKLHRIYLAMYLRSTRFLSFTEKHIHGANLPRLSVKALWEHEIPLPPLDDQKRIAHLLGKVEGLIAQRKHHLQQLDALLKSVFLEMFGDPVKNEKGWPIQALGVIGDIQGGLQVSTGRESNPIEVPYLRVANVYRDCLNLTEIKTIKVTQAELERVRLNGGDILVVEGHGNPTEIGRSSVWDGSIENCVHQNHLIRVRVHESKISPLFCSYYLNSPGGRSQMFKAGKTTSGLNTISSKNVKETNILVPPVKIQSQFATIVEKVEGIKTRYQKSLADLEALYGTLSQKAFAGELDLSRVPLVPS